MTLISILAAVIIERFLTHLEHLRWPQWFPRYAGWLHGRIHDLKWNSGVLVLLHVLGPVLVVGLLYSWLGDEVFGLVGFAFGILILIYCLGPKDLDTQVEAYLTACEAGDVEKGNQVASELIGAEAPTGAVQYRTVTDAILVQASSRVFAVLFWFAVLGPVGAILYRTSALLDDWSQKEVGEGDFTEAAMGLHWLLAWLPARLAALGYAVTGSFEDALHAWRECHSNDRHFTDTNTGLLVYAGNGALHMPVQDDETGEEGMESEAGLTLVRAALGLVWRSVIAWITVLALLTLAGLAA